jgi:quercetin dioxygenase-like cupin family protein
MQTDKGPWYEGTAGERIAVRLSSTDTNGAYAIVESFAAPGCSPPMHLHRHDEEHFVVLAGIYRILIDNRVFDAPVGTSVTVPRGARHSWRNISNEVSRVLIILTPGGFEKCIRPYATAPQIRSWRSRRIMAVSSLGHRSAFESYRPHKLTNIRWEPWVLNKAWNPDKPDTLGR